MRKTGINHGFIDLVKSDDGPTEEYITMFRPVQYSRLEREASDMIAEGFTLDLYSHLPTTYPVLPKCRYKFPPPCCRGEKSR